MRKYILLFAMLILAVGQVLAVPALPTPIQVTQPDGTEITVRLHGDEYYHYYTTLDGYTIVKNDAGYFTYAQLNGGVLETTGVIARNEAQRSSSDKALLAGINKYIVDAPQVSAAKKAKAANVSKAKIDYKNFKGLILLIQFNDNPFSRSDVKDFYDKEFNSRNYTGYTNEDGSYTSYGVCTGSARDYYYDNSNGEFDPTFDVVGPITVPYSITGSKSNSSKIIASALQQAVRDYGVDASKYDLDKNGVVDMFYMIFSGVGSNTGEADDHIWPHKSSYPYYPGGTGFGVYACSCEFYSQKYNILDGVGTICHEFTHVLGLPDLYDADYTTGGQSYHPGEWEVMASGCYNNISRTPAGYSAYDRYALGFAHPKTITAEGDYSLKPFGNSYECYKLESPVTNEFFLIANHQYTKWDKELPGHGLIIARVDSTNAAIWTGNKVNNTSSHNYYELLRAGNVKNSSTYDDPSDPFPGTKGVVFCSNTTDANLKTWNGTANPFALMGITEKDSMITFKVQKAENIKSDVEDFESMPVTATTGATDVQGNFAKWTFTKCNVAAPGTDTKCDGTHAVAMKLPSQFTSSETNYSAYMVSLKAFNTSAADYKLTLTTSTDGGTTWTNVPTPTNATANTISGNTTPTLYWNVNFDKSQNVKYRFGLTSGSKTVACYFDNFTIYYTDKGSGSLKGDVNGDGKVDTTDLSALITIILNNGTATDNPAADVNGDGKIDTTDISALMTIILAA